MLRILATLCAALFGLVFGSFLNVCLSRWPHAARASSPLTPTARTCDCPLQWWENIPVFSWLALRGRCRTCRALIGWRYTVVEASIAILWAICAWRSLPVSPDAKLMAMLAAWLGLPGALLAFFFGVVLGALFAIPILIAGKQKQAGAVKLPLGTFLCIGGIISALWGHPILATHLSWAGF